VDVRQLRYFIAVAEELHFGRAAARLHVAQPALSQQIAGLERELGVQLLERTNRRVLLTDAGDRLLAEARAVVARFDAAVTTMTRVRDGELATLRVGVFPGPVSLRLPHALAALKERYPDVEVQTLSPPVTTQEAAVADGALDLAFLPWHPSANLCTQLVAREPIGLALPSDHPLAHADAIAATELSRLAVVWMARDAAPQVFDTLMTKLEAAGGRPRTLLESATPEASLSIVAAGLAASLKTESEVIASASAGRLVWRPLADVELETVTVAAWAPQAREPVVALADLVAAAAR
jgi:DNA-binding transcriptional LysR family regulator